MDAMRTLLLVATVLALLALAVGGVSAHDGNHDDDRMNEMVDQCMEMMEHMGGMMGNGGTMNDPSSTDSTEAGSSMNGPNVSEEDSPSGSTGMGCH